MPQVPAANTFSEVRKSKPRKSLTLAHHPFPRFQPGLAFAGLFCLALIIYWPALRAPLIWDDAEMLSSSVRSPSGLAAIWRGNQVDYLPMTSTAFWIGWQLWGDHPAGYRIANLIFHVANATLIFKILRKLKVPGPGIAACIFCIHPVCVGSVAWIAELKNTLSLLLALLTIFLFFRARLESANTPTPGSLGGIQSRSAWSCYFLALLCFLLALLSKISVVMLPFALVAFAFWRCPPAFDQAMGDAREVTRKRVSKLLLLAPFFGLSLIFGLVNIWFQRHHAMTFMSTDDQEPLLTRLLGGGYAVWFYLWKSILPLNLMPIYPRWEINAASFLDWLPGLVWLALLCVCWRLSWFRNSGFQARGRSAQFLQILFFGLVFFWLMLWPVLGLSQISYFFISRVADHLQYAPLIGIAAIAGAALTGLFPGTQTQIRKFFISIPVLLLLGLAARQRAQFFADPERLWRDNLAKNPRAAMAWNNLAGILANQGRVDEALNALTEAIKLDPANMIVRESLAGALTSAGRHDEAIAEYRELLSRQPQNPRVHNNLGAALAGKGLADDAMREFKAAIELAPGFPDAHKNLGAMFYRAGQYDEAIKQFEQVLSINPDFPGARQSLLDARRLKSSATNSRGS